MFTGNFAGPKPVVSESNSPRLTHLPASRWSSYLHHAAWDDAKDEDWAIRSPLPREMDVCALLLLGVQTRLTASWSPSG